MPADTPQNAQYMVAAYVVAPMILVGYLVSLWGRVKRTVGRPDGRTVGGEGGRQG